MEGWSLARGPGVLYKSGNPNELWVMENSLSQTSRSLPSETHTLIEEKKPTLAKQSQ